ncbi:hypothetical protein Rsub_07082 [Raphidocelis subcapitata]|uniref:Importin N-terminal domain-containing protein n=1 Tax=Raphidocelis subcapitata TaxID=307507 RepID=A0A2V0PAG4_9CHLO|nr:hypothetical protein Rsub_07082 [Raphidocelis subcapitata]|eukprot:GBF94095.1 hypothetical protein Rsub_07082 [Raphidocelis subcapitata]
MQGVPSPTGAPAAAAAAAAAQQQQQNAAVCEPGQVLQLLLAALSHDQALQKQAEQSLQALEPHPGYISCLAAIVANAEANHSARWMASVQLKNAVSKQWRPRYDSRGISPEERAYMRQHVLDLISQDDSKIAVQVALVVAKIARSDYPREWPGLVSDLLGRAHGGSTLTVRRVYFVLHHVLKELSSKRLAADQRNFAEITKQLLDHVWAQWGSDLATILAGLPAALAAPSGAAAQPLLLHFERWLLLLKILRRLIVFGFPSDAKTLEPVAAVSTCAPALLQAAAALAAARPERAPPSRVVALIDRGVLKLVKTLAQIQEAHPWSFHHAGVLLPTMDFCCDRVMSHAAASTSGGGGGGGGSPSAAGGAAREALQIRCMLLLHGVLDCDAYHDRTSGLSRDVQQGERTKALAAAVSAAVGEFWSAPLGGGGGALRSSPQQQQDGRHQQPAQEGAGAGGPPRRVALLRALLDGFFPLTARELADWEEDPEAWHHATDGGAWEDSLRPCAEHLYLQLLTAQREALAPEVVAALQSANAACPPSAAAAAPDGVPGPRVAGVPAALLRREAAYAAAAVGAYELHDYVDFTSWLRGALLQELAITAPAARPLRRAAARAVGAWVPRLEPSDRPAAYAALCSALSDADAAVRLAAVAALRALVDDFGFDAPEFMGCAGAVLSGLAAELMRSDELDTQTQVFSLLNLIVERLGPDVKPFCPVILQLMPRVWEAAEGQSLLRIQVLAGLQLLVNVLGPDSPAAEPELLEDGLLLWLVALRNAPRQEPALLAPFPLLLQAMAASTEHVRAGMQIISSLVLLGGAPFLRQHGADLAGLLAGYMGAVNERGTLLLLPPLDLLLMLFPADAPSLLAPALQRLLSLLLSGGEPAAVVANGLSLLARLAVSNPGAFQQQLLSAAAASGAGGGAAGVEAVVGALTGLWVDRFDSIGQPLARKLNALALAALLPLPTKAQLAHAAGIVAHVASAWHELEASGDAEADGLHVGPIYSTPRGDDGGWGGESLALSEEAAGEAARRDAAGEAEPLRRLRVAAALRDALNAAGAAHGQDLAAAMAGLGEGLTQQLQTVLAAAG